MIVSRQNRKLKDIRALRPSKGDRCLLEGPHLVLEALALDLPIEYALATPAFLERPEGVELAGRLGGALFATDPALLEEIADADSPRGIVAVARLPRPGVEALPNDPDVVVWAERLQDPGNVGALARVAEAAGVAALALSQGSAHPNHPRALRASAGSLLRLPVAPRTAFRAVDARYAALPKAALVPTDGVPLWDASLEPPLVLLLGSEGSGLSGELVAAADVRVSVPTAACVESLNATVAAAIVLYEIARRGRS